MSQADDPWAKWRKPEAVAPKKPARKAAEPPAESVAKGVEPAVAPAPVAAEPADPVPVSGRLGLAGAAVAANRKRPVRGGALTRRPRPQEAPAAASPENAPQSPWTLRTGERGQTRATEAQRSSKPGEGGARKASAAGSEAWAPGKKTARTPAPDGSRKAGPGKWLGGAGKSSAGVKTAVAKAQRSVGEPAAGLPAPSGVRLSKIMVERGLASRREADLWIERGWVWVDGVRIGQLGARVAPDVQIEVRQDEGVSSVPAPREVIFLLHKPAGYSCERGTAETAALTLLSEENRLPQPGDPALQPWMLRNLVAAGRLETENSGLLVLMRSGGTARRLLADERELEREYLVRISGELSRKNLELLREGLSLDGRSLGKTWVKQLDPGQLHFIVREGQKRPLRRMCEAVGLTVKGVLRTRIGHLRLDKLAPGQWRFLRPDESL